MVKIRVKNHSQEEKDEKIDKDDALYLERKNTDYECKDCIFYKEKKCALYGESIEIQPFGSCNYWMQSKGENEKDWLNTTTKKESGYEENKDGYSCKRCEYFGNNKCEKVKGVISPDGCCDFWEKK